MAIYKIFPYKDSTLYSLYPNSNFGLDSISETNNIIGISGTPDVARFLTQFDTSEIIDVINNTISGSEWDVNFRTFIAEAQGISTEQVLEVYPLAQDWSNGTGEFGDSPATTNGVTWVDRTSKDVNPWDMSGNVGTELFTGSFNPTYSPQGGGSWFYSGSGVSSYKVTQSFDLRSDKDLNVGTKTIVSKWYSGSLPNYGFLAKLDSSAEFYATSSDQPILKYYSVDTNTIYPPQLEFKWRDYSTVLTGPASGSILTDSNLKLSLAENPGTFNVKSINRFRLNISPTYPPRTFQTSSYYVGKNYLPVASYYSLKDLDTNEIIFDFDDQYTQISSDNTGNYFDIYMDGLEPERYYKILIKTTIDGSLKIFDDNYYFKVING
tara:strand:- start:166 stop:1302 length:1137 start_codon:yes stop_codon:yes gene_type:complete